MAKFSIIIPVYNVALYLRECLDSVLNQTCTDWEAICVDDGSMDGSGEILDEYAKKDKRFKVIHQKNAGVGAARNAALEVMVGEWFAFLDADDVWPENVLENYYALMSTSSSADMLTLACRRFQDGNSLPWAEDRRLTYLDVKDAKNIDCKNLFYVDGLIRGFANFAYRTDIHGQNRFASYRLGEDRLYLLKCLDDSLEIVSSCAVGYGYRMRKTSAIHFSTKPFLADLYDLVYCRLECIRILAASGKFIQRAIYRQYMNKITENIVYRICKFSCKVDRDVAWGLFFDVLSIVANMRGIMSRWQLFAIKLCLYTKSRHVAIILYALPWYLKKMGIHR